MRQIFYFGIFLLLVSCAGNNRQYFSVAEAEDQLKEVKSKEFIEFLRTCAGKQLSVEEVGGVELLHKGDLKKASEKFNLALKLYPQSGSAHFLNGLTYHLMAKAGDTSKYELADVGYDLAIKFNPSNAYAPYYKGILKFDQKQFDASQNSFAAALNIIPAHEKFLYGLAVASYYAHDPRTAAGAIHQLLEKKPSDKKYLHAASLITAALGDNEKAEKYKNKLTKVSYGKHLSFIERRLKSWRDFYQNNVKHISLKLPHHNKKADNSSPFKEENKEEEMVIVDVVLILSEESNREQTGINLLNGLKLTFGEEQSKSPGLNFISGRRHGKVNDVSAGTSVSIANSQSLVTQLSIPMVSYSLNMANTQGERSEILARPSLVARHGQVSQFFSGTDLTYGIANSNVVGFKNKEVGVTLEVTPFIRDDGRVNLKIHLKRNFFTPVSPFVAAGFTSLQTATTRLSSDVIMELGDTLILGGLSDKVSNETVNATRGLSNIPLLGYLFNEKVEENIYTSVIILVTPRMPDYTYRTQDSLEKEAQRRKTPLGQVQELRARYIDWFKPYDNLASVFYQFQDNALYKEFRTGDVALEHWNTMGQIMENVESSMDFVYNIV